ncbi:restriction endonuclease [Paenibacillus sp. 1011MAR3C5]|uniref:phosphorothioated DNA-binding restriction endonuclease n=1 Tax=Paenibacillus sp. 1011MAR3C5 TaxID=1675787 RepID=UPI000E6D450D|nr:HNH endonuclease [Paenibacillus sp. 1011MAR3C5]RJE83913.1 restriction endonuclease [Paenibacillus sp. 1011MAR3C5]
MNEEELKTKFSNLSIWKKNGQRAPHKPLLLLLTLAHFQQNITVLFYEEIRVKLKKLLFEFGPPRQSYHPEEPFVRLTTDGIWELSEPVDKRRFSEKQLIDNHVTGGFTADVISLMNKNGDLIQQLAERLLYDHFPETTHQDIIEEVGLNTSVVIRRRRNPDFRNRILRAYEFSCAVCGFNVRLGHQLVAIDAAHIQWHQAGGPDREENGIALCTLHHKLFDRGVFSITNDRQFLVSEEAHGSHGFEEWLMRYHGTAIRSPINPVYGPQKDYLDWHVKEVFKGPARYYG